MVFFVIIGYIYTYSQKREKLFGIYGSIDYGTVGAGLSFFLFRNHSSLSSPSCSIFFSTSVLLLKKTEQMPRGISPK